MPFDATPNETETQYILREAARIVRRGHIKGKYCNEAKTRFCLLGAIGMAAGLPVEPDACNLYPIKEVSEKVQRKLGVSMTHKWNDQRNRTAEEVASVLEAIANEEAN